LLTPEPIVRGFDWRRIRLPSMGGISWPAVDWRSYAISGGLLLAAGGLWLLTYSFLSSSGSKPVAVETVPAQPNPAQHVQPPVVAATVQPQAPPVASTVQPNPMPALQRVATPVPSSARAAPRPAVSNPATVAQLPKAVPPANAKKPEPQLVAVTPPPSQSKAQSRPVTAPMPPKVAAAPTVVSPPPAASEIPQVSLRLEFAIASWAEVYDGEGRRLLYAVGDPSRPRTVSGKPPLKVTLGMAGSVQARVNGRPIAIPRRIGQDSASFTIGQNGAIR
jgi:cytoskeleton protein RodZ